MLLPDESRKAAALLQRLDDPVQRLSAAEALSRVSRISDAPMWVRRLLNPDA